MTIDLKLLWAIAVSALSAIAAVLGFVAVRSRKEGADEEVLNGHSDRIQKVESTLKGHDERLRHLQHDIASVPTRTELAKLHDDLSAVRQELGNVSGRLEGIGRALDLINEHLLNRS